MSARDVIANNLTFYGDMTPADLERQTDYILSALDAAGYAVVPKEPTEAMRVAAKHPDNSSVTWGQRADAIWRRMLTAAKETP